MLWRRSYDTPPPPIDPASEYSQTDDPRYADLAEVPLTECLKDVVVRLIPYYGETIAADLRAGKTVLVAAHGNSLRALVKRLEGISDADIAELNIPTGNPLRYEFDADGNVTGKGVYLDPRLPPPVPRRWPLHRARSNPGEQGLPLLGWDAWLSSRRP